MTETRDLFSIDTDPDVIAAREEWKRRYLANQKARPGRKLVSLGKLQMATEQLLRTELAAKKRLKKGNGYVDKKRTSNAD